MQTRVQVAPYRHVIVAVSLFTMLMTSLLHAEVDRNAASLWIDFNHYVRIARYDLADASGSLLLDIPDEDLLDVVEAGDYKDFEATFERAATNELVKETSKKLAEKIQAARITRSREVERIKADIIRLGQGRRANRNAIERLKAAGQFAAPHLLNALLDEDQTDLRPWVLSAIIELGRPMVYPMASALPHLEPAPMGMIAQGLAEIGYPESLPYLKDALESTTGDSRAVAVVQSAYDQLANAALVASDLTAADLYLGLGYEHYNAGVVGDELPGYDPSTGDGIVWHYTKDTGLVAIPVPSEILPDVMALRSAQRSLHFDPNLDPALSLWLMANLRRENRLPEGRIDQSYPGHMRSAEFYMVMAGPLRQHDVLARALGDEDVDLALDAIDALTTTAGTEALVNREGPIQPLIQALSYPRRSVRIAAAFALAQARPDTPFPGSHRVVPVLAEAAVQSEIGNAIVIADEQSSVNRLNATARDLGYHTIFGNSLADVSDQIKLGPGADVFITEGNVDQIDEMYRLSAADFRLSSAPIVAVVSPGDKVELTRRFDQSQRLFLIETGATNDQMTTLITHAIRANKDTVFTAERAIQIASEGMRLLREITTNRSSVYSTSEAEVPLISALDDQRRLIAQMAADVLSVMQSPVAQRAIADAALDTTHGAELRISWLGSLAESATHNGNHLTNAQIQGVLALVRDQDRELAVAAATAHGALTLPTSNMVQILLNGDTE